MIYAILIYYLIGILFLAKVSKKDNERNYYAGADLNYGLKYGMFWLFTFIVEGKDTFIEKITEIINFLNSDKPIFPKKKK